MVIFSEIKKTNSSRKNYVSLIVVEPIVLNKKSFVSFVDHRCEEIRIHQFLKKRFHIYYNSKQRISFYLSSQKVSNGKPELIKNRFYINWNSQKSISHKSRFIEIAIYMEKQRTLFFNFIRLPSK